MQLARSGVGAAGELESSNSRATHPLAFALSFVQVRGLPQNYPICQYFF